MAPITPPQTPRIVIYHQTHHTPSPTETPISILPLLTNPAIKVTHVILAALHLNDPPGNISLNDHAPLHPRNQTLWAEASIARASGVKVLCLLGGAAKGSFTRLDLDERTFEEYYIPLRDLVRERSFDGLDLDVEEEMSLAGVIRLIDRLKADFGPQFIITLAPVAAALLSDKPEHNLSGFSYEALEVMRGSAISWYNTQFYCGWGDVSSTAHYDMIIARGYPPSKVVLGMVTNPGNGAGWVPFEILQEVLLNLRLRYGPAFGGVMGWEYFNSMPGERERPWEWAAFMSKNLREAVVLPKIEMPPQIILPHASLPPGNLTASAAAIVAIPSAVIEGDGEAVLPTAFEYFTDEDTIE